MTEYLEYKVLEQFEQGVVVPALRMGSQRRGTTGGTITMKNIQLVGDFEHNNTTSKGDLTAIAEINGYSGRIQISVKRYLSKGASEFKAVGGLSLQDLIYKRKNLVNFLNKYFALADSGNEGAKRLVGAIFADVALGGRYMNDPNNPNLGTGRALFGVTFKQAIDPRTGAPTLAINTFSLSRYFEALANAALSGGGAVASVTIPEKKLTKKGLLSKRSRLYKSSLDKEGNPLKIGTYSEKEQEDYIRAKATTLTISAPLLDYYH